MAPRADIELTPGDCRPLLDDSELYGLGVRVGTYTQWLGTILTVCLVHDPKERAAMRNVNYAFAFAEWVTLVNRTRSIWPADAVIVTFLFMGTLTLLCMLEVFDRMRPRIARRQNPNLGTGGEVARMLLLSAFVIWATWWWFEGIYHTLRDCGTFIFYYGGPVRVLGDFKLIGRIWAPLLLLMLVPVLEKFWFFIQRTRAHSRAQPGQGEVVTKDGTPVGRPINIWSMGFWLRAAGATVEEAAEMEEHYESTIPERKKKQRRGLYCALLLGIGAFILIIFLEIMLAYGDVDQINEISGVGDTVPMVIGCGDMMMILWTLKQQREEEMARARLLGNEYRYPKTFLYDAEFPLLKKCKRGVSNTWRRITGRSDQNQDGQPPQDQPPQDRPPQDRPPQDQPPQDRPPQDQPPQDRPPQGQPPQDRPPQDRPPQDRPPQDQPQHQEQEIHPHAQ